MTTKFLVVAIMLISLQVTTTLASPAPATQEFADWTLHGANEVTADKEVLTRLTRVGAGQDSAGEKVVFTWASAQLHSPGRTPVEVALNITLVLGPTMSIGPHTPYPGLITKVEDAYGTLVNVSTGRATRFLISEQESTIAKFIHSAAAGADHLALEIPFALHAAEAPGAIAENRLMVRIDLSNPAVPRAGSVHITPILRRWGRLHSPDVGAALTMRAAQSSASAPQLASYAAVIEESKLSGAAGRSASADLFALDSLQLYDGGSDQIMKLEASAGGFRDQSGWSTSPVTLRLGFVPTLIDPLRKIAYLENISGDLTIHDPDATRTVALAAGNHGRVASTARFVDSEIRFEIGVALTDHSGPPAIARLHIACSAVGSRCREMTLATGVDANGQAASPTALSSVLSGQGTL